MNTKELAKALGVSSTAILVHYNKNIKTIGKHSRKVKNERRFDTTAQNIIANSFKPKIRNTRQVDLLTLQDYKDRIASLENINRNQQTNIRQLNKLLNQQQTLQLTVQNEINKMQQWIEIEQKQHHKHGLLWRLFH